jgi:hypothetical protein
MKQIDNAIQPKDMLYKIILNHHGNTINVSDFFDGNFSFPDNKLIYLVPDKLEMSF